MTFIRKLILKLLLTVSGYWRTFKKIVIGSDRGLKTLNFAEKLYDLVTFANTSVPFYRGRFDHLLAKGIDGFRERFSSRVSITDKITLKEAAKGLLADTYRSRFERMWFRLNDSLQRNLYKLLFQKDFVFSISTGGTTGTPLISYKNKQSLLTDGLLFLRGWYMMGWRPGDKVLWFYHSYYDNRFSFINILSSLTGIRLFFFDSLSDEVIEDFVRVNNSFKPKIIVTFPSYINDAATTIRKNQLVLQHYPGGIEVSGETFSPSKEKHRRSLSDKSV